MGNSTQLVGISTDSRDRSQSAWGNTPEIGATSGVASGQFVEPHPAVRASGHPVSQEPNSVVVHDNRVLGAARAKLLESPYQEVRAVAGELVFHEGVLILHGTFSRWYVVQMALVALDHGRLEGVEQLELNVSVQTQVESPTTRFDWEIPV